MVPSLQFVSFTHRLIEKSSRGKDLLELLPPENKIPIIIAGGVGNSLHLSQGMSSSKVDATATANLFNFVGEGLKEARMNLLKEGFSLAEWKSQDEIV